MAIYKLTDSTCELLKMYLQIHQQGKGIGKILLETAILKAKERGYKKMGLKTNSNLNKTIELYKKIDLQPMKFLYNTKRRLRCSHAIGILMFFKF